MSISSILLLSVVVIYGVLLIVSGGRLVLLNNSALKNTDVAKKMQFFQAWFYSLFFTLVSMSSLFLIASLIIEEEYITGIFMISFYLFTLAYSSQIDVIGSVGKNQGINDVDGVTMLQYFLNTYLMKAVWKVSGHKERNEEEQEKPSGFSKLCCLTELNNAHRPKVYDFKDIVGVQGAFLSLPTLFLLTLTFVRSQGKNSYDIDSFKFTEFDLTDLPAFLLVISAASSLLSPLLGDWETFEKSKLTSIGSVFFRSLELFSRIIFYSFFLDSTKFIGLVALFLEFVFMWLTTIKARDTSSAGRTGSMSHKILVSWESVFFTRFRRVHVDKEFLDENNTLMPYTIELIRFIQKFIVTAVGYIVIVSTDMPGSYKLFDDNKTPLAKVLLAGGIGNAIVFLSNFVYFTCIKKSELKKSDVTKLKTYWMTLQPCKLLCGSPTVHLNRDNIVYEANGNVPHYFA